MTRESVLAKLLHQNAALHPNTLLLKKYLLCVHNGWFRINGCAPDETFTLGDYLFDDERIVFDFTRLSEACRDEFLNWFMKPHEDKAFRAFPTGVSTNDYRGYTAEVGLSWWGRITNLLFYKKKSYLWNLAPIELTLNYQLNGMEISKGENGLLIGLNQFAVEEIDNKYHESVDNQDKPLRNTKRLFLTDDIVKELLATDLKLPNYEAMVHNPHPYSIHVELPEKRVREMHEYRLTQRLVVTLPWYTRLWRWLKKKLFESPSTDIEMKELRSGDKNYPADPYIVKDNVQVFKRPYNGEILIKEKRPDLDSMVFCGGGAKIYGHVGAYKAFEDAGITGTTKYAGSSAGGIMSGLCYLGYTADEIFQFFQGIRQENIIHFDIDSTGISDKVALKAALDYMIVKKFNQIVKKHIIEREDREFLAKEVLKKGEITYKSLHLLKTRYPNCGLGDKVTITATIVEERKTIYYSHLTTPDLEYSEGIIHSAGYPVVFKPSVVKGKKIIDGGVLSNLPTEAIRDDHSTFLESEYGNCLSLVAFQFDNGSERRILDKLADRVYRENFLYNWVCSMLTGVKDPVSGWERDRLKLLQHSTQVILIPVDNVSSTNFDMDLDAQRVLFKNGYKAARKYIKARYESPENGISHNEEYLYTTFANMEEVLYYCCYRGREDWFESFVEKALEEGMDDEKIDRLRQRLFKKQARPLVIDEQPECNLDINSVSEVPAVDVLSNMRLFEAIYPVFLKLPLNFMSNGMDLKLYKIARHYFTVDDPLSCLDLLQNIKGETHVLLAVFIKIMTDFKAGEIDIDLACSQLDNLNALLPPHKTLCNRIYFGSTWYLLQRHVTRILKEIKGCQWSSLKESCDKSKSREEPLQIITPAMEPNFKRIPDNKWFTINKKLYDEPVDENLAIFRQRNAG
ncbi:MAG: patatin-like phospholipase family protein [Legionella sp.]|nr:patatin-like phospholipase family protein [Legionella sp.]